MGFNPRSREGSDFRGSGKCIHQRGFQSTLPRGERPSMSCGASSWQSFQSTLPRGERRLPEWRICRLLMFQSTLPRGERLLIDSDSFSKLGFQSTLPRGERLVDYGFARKLQAVSIHAPARGATKTEVINIPTLSCFNPRSREGSDP